MNVCIHAFVVRVCISILYVVFFMINLIKDNTYLYRYNINNLQPCNHKQQEHCLHNQKVCYGQWFGESSMNFNKNNNVV